VEGCHHLPVIAISFLSNAIDFSHYDALLFTSKNAVLALKSQRNLWNRIPAYAIGTMTADALHQCNAHIELISQAKSGNRFADELIPKLQGKTALYLRAKTIVSHLPNILRNAHINLHEKIVYETRCNADSIDQMPPEKSTLLFASPSAVTCFLNTYSWNFSYRAVAFGKSTACAFPSAIPCSVSEAQTLREAIALL
jgi:uroporphyrinogen-III synthase